MTVVLRVISLLFPPLALMALIFYLSDQPDMGTGLGIWDLIGRKIIHMLEYGLLTAAWYRALNSRLLPAALIAAVYAASDEIHQSFISGRNGTPTDVLIDFAGIAIAVSLIIHFRSGPDAPESTNG